MAQAIPTVSQATALSINLLFVDSNPSCRDAGDGAKGYTLQFFYLFTAKGLYKVVQNSASQAYHCHTVASFAISAKQSINVRRLSRHILYVQGGVV
eukprot:scaffold410167_cov16-Prasinocladus_malaysianus.AAC.1